MISNNNVKFNVRINNDEIEDRLKDLLQSTDTKSSITKSKIIQCFEDMDITKDEAIQIKQSLDIGRNIYQNNNNVRSNVISMAINAALLIRKSHQSLLFRFTLKKTHINSNTESFNLIKKFIDRLAQGDNRSDIIEKRVGFGFIWQTYPDYIIDTRSKKTGEVEYTDGSKYTGEINYYIDNNGKKYARPNGEGVRLYKNGDKYEGTFKDCLMCGEGVYTFADNIKYSGIWTNGKNSAFDIANAIKTKQFSRVNPQILETITDCSKLFEKVQNKSISAWDNCNLINPITQEKFEADEKIFFIKTNTDLKNPKYEVESLNDLLQKMVSSVKSKLNDDPILNYDTTSLTRTYINDNNLVEPALQLLESVESVINAKE